MENCKVTNLEMDLSCFDFLSNFQYVDYLGSGAFGDVFRVKRGGKYYAIKVININESNEGFVVNEIEILCMTGILEERGISDNFVQFIEYKKCIRQGLTVNNKKLSIPKLESFITQGDISYYIIMEFCNTSLHSWLRNRKFSLLEYKYIVFQMFYIVMCLDFLHISHNDMSLYNFLLQYVDYDRTYVIQGVEYTIPKEFPILKLGDYGQAEFATSTYGDLRSLTNNITELADLIEEIDDETVSQFDEMVGFLYEQKSAIGTEFFYELRGSSLGEYYTLD